MTIGNSLILIALTFPVLSAEWDATQEPAKIEPSHFHAPNGLEVTVWASTPLLYNPTNIDFDAAGRAWVAEGVNYRRRAGRRPGGDRIAVLQDTDGDGQADSSHTFVQEEALIAPLGIGVFDNVVVVSQPPEIIIYTDVDRDLKFDPAIDKREVLLTGFNARNHDHSLHSVTGGPDGKWYFNNGNCGAVFTDRSGKTFRLYGSYRGGGGEWFTKNNKMLGQASDDGFKWTAGFSARMNPDGSDVEIIGHGYRNSFEHCTTSLGDLFQNDNDDPPACRTSYVLEFGSAGYFTREGHHYKTARRSGEEHWQNHWRQNDPGTFEAGDVYGGGSPTGIVFYENGALGSQHAGTLLSCEAAKNVIFGYQPEARGAGYQLDRSDWLTTNTTGEFVGGDFTGGKKNTEKLKKADPLLFRPSDVAVGADGAIYVTDWYDPRVGGHSTLDDSCSGTIYRIAPKGFQPHNPEVDLSTVDGAIAALRSPAINVRWTGFNALKAMGATAYEATMALSRDSDPWLAARAIWLFPHLGDQGIGKCHDLIRAPDPRTRLVAFRALKRAGKDVQAAALHLARDPSPAIRRDAALAMRGKPAEAAIPVLIEVAKRWDGADKNYLEAIGLGAENHEDAVWLAMKNTFAAEAPLKWSDDFTKLTWRLWPSAALSDLIARANSTSLTQEQRAFAVESIAFIDDPAAPAALFDLIAGNSPAKPDATHWLLSRSRNDWKKFDLAKQLKETGIYDPGKIELAEAIVPGKPASTRFSEDEVLALKGDSKKGKDIAMRCVMCHHVDGVGPHYGPDLKGWVERQGAAMAVRSIVDPSADIAHGFEGTAIELKNGKWIDGLALARDADPVIITSTGGVTQMVPKKRIKASQPMKRSLMFNADQLGLSAQDVADLVEWLKDY